MKKIKLIPWMIILTFVSCADNLSIDNMLDDESSNQWIIESDAGGKIVLGEQLSNPYSLRNMQKALDSLLSTKGLEPETLEATDYYVRFRPKDSLEFVTLLESDLELFDYPLDHEIIIDGDYYHDPSIPDDEITWQYTVIKPTTLKETISYEMIAQAEDIGQYAEISVAVEDDIVKCELIDECYIPEHEVLTKSGHKISVSPEELEEMAISIANLPQKYSIQSGETKGIFSKGYYPTGKLYVEHYDAASTSKTFPSDPIKGVKVRARYFLKWNSAYTNSSGYYKITTKFSCNPHLSIVFKNNNDFVIWGNYAFLFPATHNMGTPDRSKEFSHIVTHSSSAWKWAAINNAAYDYYDYCQTNGITNPPLGLRIWCLGSADWSSAPMLRHLVGYKLASGAAAATAFIASCPWLGVIGNAITTLLSLALPDIFIGTNGDNGASYDKVKAVVFHELSHASHFSVVGESFWGKYIEHIVSSWISGKDCYGDGTKNDAKQKICELGEAWGYANQRLIGKTYGVTSYGYSQWFLPAIKSVYSIIDNKIVSLNTAFSCFNTSVNFNA